MMARPNKFQIMELHKSDIVNIFDSKQKTIFTEVEIDNILTEHRHEWKLPNTAGVKDLLLFLFKKKLMTYVDINFPQRTFTRYIYKTTLKNVDIFELAMSLYKDAYISHYTAAFIHNLTDNIVKHVYINKEQKPKVTKNQNKLLQENIDYAFSKKMRTTNNFATFNDKNIYLLNGKHTKNLGVTEINNIKITNIERTLIDIAVRPAYSGGVYEVLQIYSNARGRASVNRMYAMLKRMGFIYPYHQAIGFYLERAGYNENAVKLMERFPINYKFYLDYEIKNIKFSDRWNLYYPMELDS